MTVATIESSMEPLSPAHRQRLVPNGVLGMLLFLATETMLFAGLISALLILRAQSEAWPPPGQPRLPVAVTGINTVVLLLSGYTARRALESARAGLVVDRARMLGATALLGATFLLVQGIEWVRLIGFGLTTSSSRYGATFYTLIGCHALHVAAALVALLVVFRRVLRNREAAALQTDIEVCQLYWLFVVGVWPILYVLVYLL